MKIKDKKIVCLVILGVSIVSLLVATLSGLVTGMIGVIGQFAELAMYGEMTNIFGVGFNFMQSLIGAAFATVFFFNKKQRNTVNIALSASLAGLFVASLILMFILNNLGVDLGGFYNSQMSYISFCLTLIISSALMIVSDILARKYTLDIETAVNSQNEQPDLNNGSVDSDNK